MIKLIELRPPTSLIWKLLTGMGLLVPALIGTLKGIVLHATLLRDLQWGFIPLSGPIDGIWPHALYRIMHNLSHPFLLVAYAVTFARLPFMPGQQSHTSNVNCSFSAAFCCCISA